MAASAPRADSTLSPTLIKFFQPTCFKSVLSRFGSDFLTIFDWLQRKQVYANTCRAACAFALFSFSFVFKREPLSILHRWRGAFVYIFRADIDHHAPMCIHTPIMRGGGGGLSRGIRGL